MKVALVTPFPIKYMGGVEAFSRVLIKELSGKVDFEVVSLTDSESAIIPKWDRLSISALLWNKVRNVHADVVHANAWAAFACRGLGTPLLATAHGTMSGYLRAMGSDAGALSRAYSSTVTTNLEKTGFRAMGLVAAVSHDTKWCLVHDYNMDKKSIDVVYNSVDTVRFRRTNTRLKEDIGADFLAVGVGRLVKQKGFEYAVRALKGTPKGFVLMLVGGGPDKPRLCSLARDLGVSDRVIFAGPVDEAKKIECLSAADAFICPSLWESFGIVAAEAMAVGLPIISSDVGGLPEVIGRAGLTVPPRDAEALRKALLLLMEDEKKRKTMGSNARKRAMLFDSKHMARKYASIYARLAGD